MKFLALFFFVICPVVIICYHYATKKYINPYKLIMIFGKKGCGKTTLLTKIALQNIAKGKKVYSTEIIPGTYTIDPHDIGHVELDEDSVLLVDEAGIWYNNRKYKDKNRLMTDEVIEWYKLQRHRKITVYLFSQTFDVDVKLRDLTDEMYLVTKVLRVFSYSKRILKRIVLNKSSAESPSKIDEDLVFDSILLFPFGSRKLTYIPKYSKYFDSFTCRPLLNRPFPYVQPLKLPPVKRSRLFSFGGKR